VYADGIVQMLDELQANHQPVLDEYLKDATDLTADSIKYVAPFIGYLLDSHLFTPKKMPKKDLDWVFQDMYGKNTSAVSKMSNKCPLDETQKLFDTAEMVMKKYSKP
jgi:hypothetical protein